MKPGLLLVALLLFTVSADAQHCHAHSASSVSTGGPQWTSISFGGGTINSAESGLRHEPRRTDTFGYAKNDGEYIPSTYMNYEEALALGKQQILDAQLSVSARPTASVPLGDVARLYRNLKMNSEDALAPGKQQLADVQVSASAKLLTNLPLGDVARFYRSLKTTNLQASFIRVDSDKLRDLTTRETFKWHVDSSD